MNVYVESNFILELAFQQEEHDSCEEILSLCEAGRAHLVLPAFCIAEPYEALGRRHKNRMELRDSLDRELKQLARSSAYREDAEALRSVTGLLAQSAAGERRRVAETLDRLLQIAEIIPLNLAVLTEARRGSMPRPQDSIVHGSVLSHASGRAATPSCFISKDREHFGDPDIVSSLARHGCRMILGFCNGRDYLRHQTRPTSPQA